MPRFRQGFILLGLLSLPLWGQKVWSPFGTEFLKQQWALFYDWTAENSDTNRRFRLNVGGDAFTGGFDGFATFSENLPGGRLTLNVLDTPVDWSPWLLSRPTRPKAYPDVVKPTPYYGLLAEVEASNLGFGFYYAGNGQDSYSWGDGVSAIANSLLSVKVMSRLGPLQLEVMGVSHWHRDLTTNMAQNDLLSPDLFSVNDQFYFESLGVIPGFTVEALSVEGEAGLEAADMASGTLPAGLFWNNAPLVTGASGAPQWVFAGDAVLMVSNRAPGKRLKKLVVTLSGNLQVRRKRQEALSTDKLAFRPVAWSQVRGPDVSGFAPSQVVSHMSGASFRRTLVFEIGQSGHAGLGLRAQWRGRSFQARLDWALQQNQGLVSEGPVQALRFDAHWRTGRLLWGLEAWGHEGGFGGSLDGDPAVELSPSAGVRSAYRVADPSDMLRAAPGQSPGFFWFYENPTSHFLSLGNDLDQNGAEDDREVGLATGQIDPSGMASAGGRLTMGGNVFPDFSISTTAQVRYREGTWAPLISVLGQWERVFSKTWQARAALVEVLSPSPQHIPSPSLYQVDFFSPAGLIHEVLARADVQMDRDFWKLRGELSASWRQFEGGRGRFESTPLVTVERPIALGPKFTLIPRWKFLWHGVRGGMASSDSTNNLWDYDRALFGDMSETFHIMNIEGRWRHGPLAWLNGLELAFYDQQVLGEGGSPAVATLPNPVTRLAATSRFEYKGNYLGRPVGLSFQIQGGLWADTRPKYLPPLDQWKKFSAVEMRLFTGF